MVEPDFELGLSGSKFQAFLNMTLSVEQRLETNYTNDELHIVFKSAV